MITISLEETTYEYMYNWLQESYKSFGSRNCYKEEVIYDDEMLCIEKILNEVNIEEINDEEDDINHSILNATTNISLEGS